MKETFYCPHCQAQLTKSPQAYALGEMLSNKQARFIVFGDADNLPPVVCPACGRSIDSNAMVAGKYDNRRGVDADGCLPPLAVAIGIGILMGVLHVTFWAAVGIVMVGVVVFELLRSLLKRSPSGTKE